LSQKEFGKEDVMVRRRATGATAEVTLPTEATPTAISGTVSTGVEKSLLGLKVELEQATQREELMQRQVDELQRQLVAVGDRLKTVQAELDDCKALPAKLAQSEETIRQLAQANTQLNQDLEALQAKSAAKAQSKSQPKAPAADIPPQTKPANAKAALSPQQSALVQHQRQMLAHPVFPDKKLPGQMADQDLGWFD
jgi:DNA repair ATPase RecN